MSHKDKMHDRTFWLVDQVAGINTDISRLQGALTRAIQDILVLQKELKQLFSIVQEIKKNEK